MLLLVFAARALPEHHLSNESRSAISVSAAIAAMIPPTLFFFVALHIIVFIRLLMLKQTGITLGTTASVILTALIPGKAVVIADLLSALAGSKFQGTQCSAHLYPMVSH